MIYGVGMRSRGPRQNMPGIGPGGLQAALMADWPDPGLARVAEETGGGYVEIRAGQDLGAAFAQVADELHSQYLIGFAPPKRDGKVHDVEVRVSQKGMKPRGRKSYVAPKEKSYGGRRLCRDSVRLVQLNQVAARIREHRDRDRPGRCRLACERDTVRGQPRELVVDVGDFERGDGMPCANIAS